jgi:two-component system, cell cycle sensor histidine kinase and response regulator CckA
VILIDLVSNIALLVTLTVAHRMVMRRWRYSGWSLQAVSGLLFGVVGLIGMMAPVKFVEGIIFDGRSIVLSIAGVFGGPLAAVISGLMCGAYRAHLGGGGVWMGLSVIAEASALGVAFHYLRKRDPRMGRPLPLLGLGVAVHVVMLALTTLLPGGAGAVVRQQIGLTILLAYPIATMLVGTVFVDGEERLAAERSLRESEERFRSMAEQMADLLFVADPEGILEYVSPASSPLLGREPSDVVGRRFVDLVAAEDAEHAGAALRGVVEDGVPCRGVTLRLPRRDGTHLAGELVATRTGPGGKPGVLGIVRDVTDRLALEAQLRQAQKMESVGRLAGGIAHDFNNMLAVIMGYAEMALQTENPSAQLSECLTQIHGASERSAALVKQLLAFARQQPIMPVVLDLNQAVSGVLKMLGRLLGEGTELVWRPGPDLWSVLVDPNQFDQVLANLAVNARDAIVGTGTVTIETSNTWLAKAATPGGEGTEGAYVMLSLSDTGSGMDAATVERIFDPFFSTKEVGQGTGLGLAMVYGAVRQHDGVIEVDSEPGRGTTFRIFLPRAASTVSAPAAPPLPSPPHGGTEVVLLVEDEAMVLSLGATLLESLGYTVLAAASPGEALTLVAEHSGRIDILVTDVVMPMMSGPELAERLCTSLPGLKCLYASGHAEDVVAHEGIVRGGTRVLQKPFSVASLASAVREVLDAP